MSDFKAKMHQILSAETSIQAPMGDLTALPQDSLAGGESHSRESHPPSLKVLALCAANVKD